MKKYLSKCFSMMTLVLLSATAFADDGYKLGSVAEIEVLDNNDIQLTYFLNCRDVDFETFVGASDDSGDREVRVGVVYSCEKGPLKKFSTVLTPSSPEYKVLEAGLVEGASFAPMSVSRSN